MKIIYVVTAIEQHRWHRSKPEVLSRLRDPFIHRTENVKTSSPSGDLRKSPGRTGLRSRMFRLFVTEKTLGENDGLFSESTPTYKHSLKSYLSKLQCTWVGRHRLHGNDCRSGGKASFTTGRRPHTYEQRRHINGRVGGN